MKHLVTLLLVLLPTLAFADQSFNDGTGATVDCAKDPKVQINANDGTYTLTGACKSVQLNGNNNSLTIETVGSLQLNGNGNTLTIASAESVQVPGNTNTVTLKKHAKVNVLGNDNTVVNPKAVTPAKAPKK